MTWTNDVVRDGNRLTLVGGFLPPEHLASLYLPPAWTGVECNLDPSQPLLVTGFDSVGRKQYLYSPEWHAQAKAGKFERVRCLLAEYEDIRSQMEADLNRVPASPRQREAVLCVYLIYLTGIRPGSTADTRSKVQAFGATTLQLRHVTLCPRGVRLKFVGKKGVAQNILVTDPYLVRLFEERKGATTAYTTPLFQTTAGAVNQYIATLGSGDYTAKDLRTARGTSVALKLLGNRQRVPKAASRRKKIVNDALDQVAKVLGNTRAVSRGSYVDPLILHRFLS